MTKTDELVAMNNKLCSLDDDQIEDMKKQLLEVREESLRNQMLCDFIEYCMEKFDKQVSYLEFWLFIYKWTKVREELYGYKLMRKLRAYNYQIQ